ncbi:MULTISPECIES: DMT family transporter [unclassified Flavobacterium]|uniref:EamA family transporter n=1 Tax=unclassified Flavobacterium TaxID=196869 RepID=UPI001F141B37|nr:MULTISPECIES: DMT family transporter [unclassified Flavobacterium]UMY65634.1 DMT family transporter [Flavobacterium sp. HJ-32-4]
MGNREFLKGIGFVALGATSYGMLATFVKLAYGEGYTTAEVTVSQFVIGLLGLGLINLFMRSRKTETVAATRRQTFSLLLAGTSMGFTSLFYYIAVKYIPVSVAIVLLMQTVWMGVVLEALLTQRLPSLGRVTAVAVVLAGTVLAANLLDTEVFPDWRGIVWGMLAAASFTTTMFTANKVALGVSAAQRSLWMLAGGAVIVFSAALFTQTGPFQMGIFLTYGLAIAVFGTIIPPLLLNAGFPKAGIGPGSIVASLELPVSVTMAWVLLHETVQPSQWLGIVLILAAIVLLNLPYLRKKE